MEIDKVVLVAASVKTNLGSRGTGMSELREVLTTDGMRWLGHGRYSTQNHLHVPSLP